LRVERVFSLFVSPSIIIIIAWRPFSKQQQQQQQQQQQFLPFRRNLSTYITFAIRNKWQESLVIYTMPEL